MNHKWHGEDRAKYGDKLINRLANKINRKGFEPRRLREYRQLYVIYPLLGAEVKKYIQNNQLALPSSEDDSIWRLPSAKLETSDNQDNIKWRTTSAKLEEWSTPPERLFNRLNFSSLLLLCLTLKNVEQK